VRLLLTFLQQLHLIEATLDFQIFTLSATFRLHCKQLAVLSQQMDTWPQPWLRLEVIGL
jgi:hypothetical protein